MSTESNYEKYRGKCKEFCEEAIRHDPSLKMVRGYYFCPIWNSDEPHWWCVKLDGTIYDPTVKQFPSAGMGIYTEFDGNCECANCGKIIPESNARFDSRYAFCSTQCNMRFVGF